MVTGGQEILESEFKASCEPKREKLATEKLAEGLNSVDEQKGRGCVREDAVTPRVV